MLEYRLKRNGRGHQRGNEVVEGDMEIKFDEVAHTYSIGGKFLPSVTGILKKATLVDFSGIPEDVLEVAREFGSTIHKVCEMEDKGILDLSAFTNPSEPIIPYLEGWRKFLKDTKAEILEIEKPVYSTRWGYAGTPDRVIYLPTKKQLAIPDIKTSATLYPSMRIQLAGYKLAWEEMNKGKKIKQRMVVQLLEGDYRLHMFDDESDTQIFIAAVQICKFKRRESAYYGKGGEWVI